MLDPCCAWDLVVQVLATTLSAPEHLRAVGGTSLSSPSCSQTLPELIPEHIRPFIPAPSTAALGGLPAREGLLAGSGAAGPRCPLVLLRVTARRWPGPACWGTGGGEEGNSPQ